MGKKEGIFPGRNPVGESDLMSKDSVFPEARSVYLDVGGWKILKSRKELSLEKEEEKEELKP